MDLLHEFWALVAFRTIPPGVDRPDVDLSTRILSAISSGFDDPLFSISDVVIAVGRSERTIRDRLGQQSTSFRAEVLKRRMAKAQTLLATSTYTIDEVSLL